MRIAWHKERDTLYVQAKQNPKNKAVKVALNDGAKKYFADRKDIYNQLVELRKNWLNARKDLGYKINEYGIFETKTNKKTLTHTKIFRVSSCFEAQRTCKFVCALKEHYEA